MTAGTSTYLADPAVAVAEQDIRPLVDNVFDQGSAGSCTANAFAEMCAITEERAGRPYVARSRRFNYFTSRALLGLQNVDGGSTEVAAAQAAAMLGLPLESDCPYDLSQINVQPDAPTYAKALDSKVTFWQTVASVADIKSALADGMPVSFQAPVPAGYYDVTGTFDQQAGNPNQREWFCAYGNPMIGYHQQIIIGSSDRLGGWLVQNSWGPSWGDGGFVLWPYTAFERSVGPMQAVSGFNGVNVQDHFARQLSAITMQYLGRVPFVNAYGNEVDLWRQTGLSLPAIAWYITTTPEFKARLKLYAPAFYKTVYGDFDPSTPTPPMPPTPPGHPPA